MNPAPVKPLTILLAGIILGARFLSEGDEDAKHVAEYLRTLADDDSIREALDYVDQHVNNGNP